MSPDPEGKRHNDKTRTIHTPPQAMGATINNESTDSNMHDSR